MATKNCEAPTCGKEFVHNYNGNFCSVECQQLYMGVTITTMVHLTVRVAGGPLSLQELKTILPQYTSAQLKRSLDSLTKDRFLTRHTGPQNRWTYADRRRLDRFEHLF